MTWKVTFVQVGISQFFKDCDPFVLYSLSLSMQFLHEFWITPHVLLKIYFPPFSFIYLCLSYIDPP